MSQATQRTRLKTILQSVSNIGVVHDYQRFNTDYMAFINLFDTTIGGVKQLRGWTVAFGGLASTDDLPDQFDGQYVRGYRWTIRGYMGLQDSAATEKTFAALVETVCDALDDDDTLHGATYYDASKAEAPVVEERLFGSVLCHYCEIRLIIFEVKDD